MDAIEPYAEDCKCDGEFVWVVRTLRNSTKQYGKQCLWCGKMIVMRRTKIPFNVELLPYDENIGENYQQRRRRFFERSWSRKQAEFEANRQAENREWWLQYEEYLGTQQWADKRQRVLQRDDFTCQACMTRKATEVHHLTYARVFNEPLFDLVSICSMCHNALTEMDRCRRR